ncbi:DUF5009 domain-containing protein [Sphingobacterium suaedae]|uniref:DUF5009 domain-containing protein n=1 Tax=Sphingobacterium suaedae TaxID=1686402 RepID=A0ABW5KL05_9SPHI
MKPIAQRSASLDVLRGVSILLMVLSSSIAFGILPGWMYHAQVPPPAHVFDPDRPGITWVDLVFPFFLFTMGAAIPLAMQKRLSVDHPLVVGIFAIGKRFIALLFFSVFTFQARAWVLHNPPGWDTYLVSLFCFLLLFGMYTDFSRIIGKKQTLLLKTMSCVVGVLIIGPKILDGEAMTENRLDIILLVLAHMALFGTLWWWMTRNYPLLRIGLLPFLLTILLGSGMSGSFHADVFAWTPLAWVYKFYYLKYLFIVVPATCAGEWIIQEQKNDRNSLARWRLRGVVVLSIVLVIANVASLYARVLNWNLLLNFGLLAGIGWLAEIFKDAKHKSLLQKLLLAGAYLLLLGLFAEAFEGGIKKDYSTFSYYFVCTGLAFFALALLHGLEQLHVGKTLMQCLAWVGRNPMVAYTAGNLFVIPVLALTGTQVYLDQLTAWGPWMGFMRGVLFTTVVAGITVFTAKKGLFWKT